MLVDERVKCTFVHTVWWSYFDLGRAGSRLPRERRTTTARPRTAPAVAFGCFSLRISTRLVTSWAVRLYMRLAAPLRRCIGLSRTPAFMRSLNGERSGLLAISASSSVACQIARIKNLYV